MKQLFKKAMAIMLAVALVLPNAAVYSGTTKTPFKDVNGHWAESEINEMYQKGLIKGDKGNFNPDKKISRAEFAVMLTNAFHLEGQDYSVSNSFEDTNSSTWYAKYVDAAAPYLTYFENDTDGTLEFRPTQNAVREDVAVALVVASGLDNLDAADLSVLNAFSDSNKISPRLRESLAIAIENELMGGYAGKLNPQAPITRAEVAKLVISTMHMQTEFIEADKLPQVINTKPTISILSPETSATADFVLSGKTQKGNVIYVNGDMVYVNFDGTFSFNSRLNAGDNTFKITASNAAGKIAQDFNVNYAPKGLVLDIQAPETVNIEKVNITGRVSDPKATVYAQGYKVTVKSDGTFTANLSNLAKGDNKILFEATSPDGVKTKKEITIKLKAAAPDFTVSAPDTVYENSVTIQGRLDAFCDDIYINGKDVTSKFYDDWSWNRNKTGKEKYTVTLKDILTIGDNTIEMKAVSIEGEITVKTVKVKYAVNAPKLVVTVPDNVTTNSVEVTGNVKDNNGLISVYVNDKSVYVDYDKSFSHTIKGLKEGQNKITIKATNKEGIPTVVEKTVNFNIGAPTLTVTIPELTATKSFTITGNVENNNIKVYVNGAKVSYINYDGSFEHVVNLRDDQEGDNIIKVEAFNTHGKSTAVTKVVKFEMKGPELKVAAPTETSSKTVTLTINTESTNAVYVNGYTVKSGWYSNSREYDVKLTPGTNTVKVEAVDKLGKRTIVNVVINYTSKESIVNINPLPDRFSDSLIMSGNAENVTNLKVMINGGNSRTIVTTGSAISVEIGDMLRVNSSNRVEVEFTDVFGEIIRKFIGSVYRSN